MSHELMTMLLNLPTVAAVLILLTLGALAVAGAVLVMRRTSTSSRVDYARFDAALTARLYDKHGTGR